MKSITNVENAVVILAIMTAGVARAQDRVPCIAPDAFLPSGNVQTSEAGVVRVYKVGSDRKIGAQPSGYPRTLTDPAGYQPAEDERVRRHDGIDYSSHDRNGRAVPLEFKAGVHGTVLVARDGFIQVEVDDRGNRVEFLHNSSRAKGITPGVKVSPETILGKTGNLNPTGGKALASMGIHLHVQAKNKKNEALDPCEVLKYAAQPRELRREARFFTPFDWTGPKPLKPIDWDEFKEAPRPRETLFFDENAPKKKPKD